MPSASKTLTIYSNGGHAYTLKAEFTETSTSTPNNTSTLTCKASLIPTNAYWSTSYSSSLAIYWHDNRENTDRLVNSINFSGINSGETKSTEGSITIYHKEDGSLSGYAYAYFTKGSTTSSYAPNSAGIATDWTALTSISRYPMITSAPNFDDEQNPTITYTTTSGFSNATYTACISLTGAIDDVPYRAVDLNAGSYTFELTETERNTLRYAARNSNNINVIFYLRTIVGNAVYLSTATRTLSIVNADPEISSLTVTETNQDVIDVLGSATSNSIIPSVSYLHAVLVPSANKEATITKVSLVKGSTITADTTSPYEFDFSPSSSQTFIVTDSRGNTTGVTVNKNVLPYIPISFVNFTFERYNPTSSNIILNLEANYEQQTYNQTPNVPIVKWKLDDGTFNTIPSTEYTIDTTNHKLIISDYELTNVLPYTSKGNFTISIEDLFTNAVDTQYVLKGIPTYDEGEHDLQVNGDLFIADTNGENAVNVKDLHKVNIVTDGNATATGRYVDGKPEYVKRITTSIASSTNKTVSTGLTVGTHEIIDYKGYITNNLATGIKVRDGFYYGADNSFMVHVNNGTGIQVITGSNTNWIAANDVCILEVYYIDIS